MNAWSAIVTVAVIHLLAVISPGPDFIMTVRNALVYGRRAGQYSAIGLGLGILVHVTYCLLGVAVIISQSILLFSIIKYIGAVYLIYIGFKSIMARKSGVDTELTSLPEPKNISAAKALRMGFITNVTNPKATLFFLSLFTLVIRPNTPVWAKLVMSVEMVLVTMLWFALVAVVVSHRHVKGRMTKFQHWAEKLMGGFLILFGIKLGTTHLK